MKTYECVFYNGWGDEGNYELLDFDPNRYLKGKLGKKAVEKVKDKAWSILRKKYKLTDKLKMLETLYLLPVDSLVRLG